MFSGDMFYGGGDSMRASHSWQMPQVMTEALQILCFDDVYSERSSGRVWWVEEVGGGSEGRDRGNKNIRT